MPRFLRRNIGRTGILTTSATTKLAEHGRRVPAIGTGPALIHPQCIAWPFSTDIFGESFPSGTVGVRSVAQSRQTTERNWGTPGHADEGEDRWIAVPDTLPSGYTSRPASDVNRGPKGSSTARGAPYFDVTFDDDYVGTNAYGDSAGNCRFIASVETGGPKYRPTGGGGIVGPLTWYPMNVSDKAIQRLTALAAGGGSPNPGSGWDFSATAIGAFVTYPIATVARHPGFRKITIRISVSVAPAYWAARANTDIKSQVIIRYNANGATTPVPGDTLAYKSAVFNKNAFTSGPANAAPFAAYSAFYYDLTLTTADYGITATPASGFRALFIQSATIIDVAGANTQGFHSWGSAADRTYSWQYQAHPRVDIPLWFSAYGQGVIAPGGVT